MKPSEVIYDAIDLLTRYEGAWCQGATARDVKGRSMAPSMVSRKWREPHGGRETAYAHCLDGALLTKAPSFQIYLAAVGYLDEQASEAGERGSFVCINDDPTTTIEDVTLLMKHAAHAAELAGE